MKAIAIFLIFSLAVMSINTQAVQKPKASGKVKVHVKAKVPSVKAKTSLGGKVKVGGKVTAKPKAKVNIKVHGKTSKVTKPKAKVHLKIKGKAPKVSSKAKGKMHVKLHLGGKAKASTKAKGKLHMKIKVHGKAKKAVKKASLCTAKLNVFGLKMIQGNAITKDTACGLKESCVKLDDFKAATAKVNKFADKLGSWIWSKQTLAKWINFVMTKVDYPKAAKMCGVTVPAAKPSTDKPKAKVNIKVNAKAAPKKRILQAVKAKSSGKAKAKVSVKAKAKVPKAKVSVKAKKPAVKGKAGLKLKLGGKAKASTKAKGKLHMKVKVHHKSSAKVHVKVKSAKRKYMKLGMKNTDARTGVQWDDLMIKNAKCNGIFVKQFMPLVKKCAPFQSYYGRAVRKCAKSIYKLRKNLMCASTIPSKGKAFENGMPKLSSKFWKKSSIGACLTAAMFEQTCIRPQLKAMNDVLQSTKLGKTNFATKIAAWEELSGTKKSACVSKMTNLFNGKKLKVHLKLKVKGKKSTKKSGLKLKLHSKTKAKAGLKLKVKGKTSAKPKAKAGLKLKVKGKTSVKPKAKAGLKLKVKGKASAKPKAKAGLKLKVKAHKKDRILQAVKAKGKAKAKVSVKAKAPKAKVSVKAKKPAVKGKAGLKLKLGGKAKASTKSKGKAGLKLKLGGKAKTSSKAKGKLHMKVKLNGKSKVTHKKKVHVKVKIHKKKAYKSQWYSMLKKLGKFKWGKEMKLSFSKGGNCLASMTPFLLNNLKNPVTQFQDTRFVYDLLDQAVAAWGSESDIASYWKKFFITALKDEKSYTSATAAAPVKKTDAKKTDAKKPAAKKPAAKKDDKKPAAKKDDKKPAAKKDDKKKRRMQAATTSSSGDVDVADASSKDAGVTKVDVKPAPGQETPFDASAKLISLSVVTALLVAFM